MFQRDKGKYLYLPPNYRVADRMPFEIFIELKLKKEFTMRHACKHTTEMITGSEVTLLEA